jgi:hypothetical protein
VLADLLKVDLQDLRRKYDDAHEAQAASTGSGQTASGPVRSRIAYRHVHQAYLRILLEREEGSSAFAAIELVSLPINVSKKIEAIPAIDDILSLASDQLFVVIAAPVDDVVARSSVDVF